MELADGMADAGINVVLAANNHIMDEGSAGLNTMMSYFSTKYPNITLLGVNNSREAKDEPVYVETNNIKIAMIIFNLPPALYILIRSLLCCKDFFYGRTGNIGTLLHTRLCDFRNLQETNLSV